MTVRLSGRALVWALAGGMVLAIGACSSTFSEDPPVRSFTCLDDSRECVADRGARLKAMTSDPSRRWVREPATADAYASGVRLFAFRTKKRELTCEELSIGRREADAAGAVVRGPQGRGLSPAQISRAAMFGQEVSRELAGEMKRRCRA